ncbi:hypothetical protein, partial [Serratia marcescens]|uniref:hypothetical protein n=1 Tax=Serratia marcescens TaxID=615 RepID=UPI0028131FED
EPQDRSKAVMHKRSQGGQPHKAGPHKSTMEDWFNFSQGQSSKEKKKEPAPKKNPMDELDRNMNLQG